VGLIVNGQSIDDRRIELEMAYLRPEYEQAFADMEPGAREAQLREWATENVIEHTLIAQAAAQADIVVPSEEVDHVFSKMQEGHSDPKQILEELQCQDEDQARQRVLENQKAAKLIDRAGRGAPKPTDKQVEQYYKDHKEQFVRPEQVRVAQVVKQISWRCNEQEAHRLIQQAKAELDRGMAFEWVVERYSDGSEPGGSLGLVGRGDMVGEFEDVVFNLGPGQTSEVFRTRHGFHIVKVYDRIPPQPLSLSDVRGHIEASLSQELRSEAIYAFVDSLRAKACIEKS
jgi:peptidyl-prolyl cis-trans isomerase C